MTKKRWIVWIIAGAMAASMTACGGTKDGKADDVQVVAENMVQKGTESEVINKKDQEPASEAEMGAVEETEKEAEKATENGESGKTTESTEKFEKFETDTEEQSSTEAESEPIEGGWTKADSAKITKEHKKLFEKATKELVGATYEPVALLETQVVAGTNYRFLCKITPVVPNGKPRYSVVELYEDLSGNVSITKTMDSELEAPTEQLDGGYSEDISMKLSKDAKVAFSKATETLTGVSYDPVLFLGSQVVAGTNYRILCRTTAATAGAEEGYAILTIYADLEGNATISDIAELK